MIIIKKAKDLKKLLLKHKESKKTVGFVPTMGALHQGHLSLINQCNETASLSVCSIFVNPTQFNNPEDLMKYPKTIESDILLLEQGGCDILFLPDEQEIYPDEKSKQKEYDLDYLENILEGKFRPGHFQGVCLVMERLLNIVDPDFLFLGQKDFQQCLVIERLVDLMNKDITIVICPIVREPSGLAMSSRNLRLNPSDRKLASMLYQTLDSIKTNLNYHNFQRLRQQAILELGSKGFKVEYLELAKRNNLEIIENVNDGKELVLLIAAFLNGIRLIDNVIINI